MKGLAGRRLSPSVLRGRNLDAPGADFAPDRLLGITGVGPPL
jgi:hypothetical protein